MKQTTLQILVASTLLACASVALALPFNSFDPRSMGMGGAGVAVGNSSTAPFFNPALLTISNEDNLFSVDFPIIGARVYDPDDFKTSLDDFQNGNYVENMDQAITNFSTSTTATSAQINAISNSTSILSTQFATLSDKPIQGELGAGLVIGVPNKDFGIAFYANGWGAIGGIIKYRDDATLQSFISMSNSVASAIQNDCAGAVVNTAACTSALLASIPDTDPNPLIATNQFFTIDATTPTPTVTSSFNSNSLTSTVNIRGVVLSEVGVALSTEMDVGSSVWGVGITPKIVRATLIDYSADINTGSTNNIDGDDYSAKYTRVNFDLGLTKEYPNGWRTGFVIKNIIPRSLDFKSIAPGAMPGTAKLTTGTLKLRAQARVGASYSNDWSTVALDVDLTNNDPAGFESPSKYVALGAEFDAMGWAQFRVGYRADVRNSNRNVASVGVGISPFGVVHIDLAATGSANEVGGSARLAFTF